MKSMTKNCLIIASVAILSSCSKEYVYNEAVPELSIHSVLTFEEARELMSNSAEPILDSLLFKESSIGSDYWIINDTDLLTLQNLKTSDNLVENHLLLTTNHWSNPELKLISFVDPTVEISGDSIEKVTLRENSNEFGISSGVLLASLNDSEKKKFEEYTRSRVGKQVGIILNDQLVSAPRIMEPIPGGLFMISTSIDFSETAWEEFKRENF